MAQQIAYIIAWLAFWFGVSYALSKLSKSKLVSIGGGFVAAVIAVGVLGIAIQKNEQNKLLKVAQSAGFSNYSEYTRAKSVGATTKTEYDEKLEAKRIAELHKRIAELHKQEEQQRKKELQRQKKGVVIQALEPNKLGVGGREFKTKPNPKGEGVFVYDPRTRFKGVKRILIWIVLDNTAYPLNGPSKMITPSLSWPREVDAQLWKKTGLSPYMTTDAIEIVFGKK